MKYKVGDLVRIKDKKCILDVLKKHEASPVNQRYEQMKHLCGNVAKIKHHASIVYSIDIDEGQNMWYEEMFEILPPTIQPEEIDIYKKVIELIGNHIGENSVKYYFKTAKQMLSPILEENEQKYLASIISMYRDYVEYICKIEGETDDYIIIYLNDCSKISLPIISHESKYICDRFEYRGMEYGKHYTLKELF